MKNLSKNERYTGVRVDGKYYVLSPYNFPHSADTLKKLMKDIQWIYNNYKNPIYKIYLNTGKKRVDIGSVILKFVGTVEKTPKGWSFTPR